MEGWGEFGAKVSVALLLFIILIFIFLHNYCNEYKVATNF